MESIQDNPGSWFHSFWKWVNENYIFRRCTIIWVLFVSWESLQWAMKLAENTDRTPEGAALLIGAVMVPVAALQKFALEDYYKARA